MNKIYKLVYSKTLNQLVAVSELAKSAEVETGLKAEVAENAFHTSSSASLNKLALTFVLSSLATALPLAVSASQARAETPNSQPVATATQNSNDIIVNHLNQNAQWKESNKGIVVDKNHAGSANVKVNYARGVIPVIDIAEANAAGVSDNRFSKFKTDTGVMFNNQAGTQVKTMSVLGEKIESNPNLKRAAKTILAQMTGNDKTVIRGAMQIIGEKADLVVINSKGIDLNGVHLVNVKDFTASTAKTVGPESFNRHVVEEGTLNIGAEGLTSEDVDTIRLIAQAVKVNAQIKAVNKNTGKKSEHRGSWG